MLIRVIGKALVVRKRRWMVAAIAVLLAASLVTALLTLSLEMGSKVTRELESYGANLLVIPEAVSLPAGAGGLPMGQVAARGYIKEEELYKIEDGQVKGIKNYVPYLYTVAILHTPLQEGVLNDEDAIAGAGLRPAQGDRKGRPYAGGFKTRPYDISSAGIHEQKVIVAGTLFNNLKELNAYWKIEGGWIKDDDKNGSIIGKNVALRFSLRPGDELYLEFRDGRAALKVAGIAEVGGSEDNQIFIPLETAQAFSGRTGQVDLLQIRASTEAFPLSSIASVLDKTIPGIKAKVIGQIAEAEKNVLSKIRLLIALITALVLMVAAVAVFSTMSASVLERTKEIGLMKALGARDVRIATIFLAEAVAIGISGGIAGNILGLGLAQLISRSVFNTYLQPQVIAAPVTLAVALAVTTLASLWPVKKALNVKPIIALRGE